MHSPQKSGELDRPEQILIALAVRYPLFLAGLRSAVRDESDLRIIAECTDIDRTREALRRHAPDVLIVGEELLDDGVDELRAFLADSPTTRTIVLSGRKDGRFMQRALKTGVRGVFQREQPTQQVPLAIRKVHGGELWFEREVASHMLSDLLNHPNGHRTGNPKEISISSITGREQQVIALACEGLRNKEISRRLRISEATVSHHLTSIFRKLQLEDRTSLVIFAIKNRLVPL